MSDQVFTKVRGRGFWVALGGVVFCDFIGVMLLSLGGPGWVLGLATMFLGAPYSAWMALEAHPDRRALSCRLGIANAVILVVLATVLFAFVLYMLSTVQWG